MDQKKGIEITNRIMVYGMVQGVGFRPLVYRIAKRYGIKGTVRNTGGAVEILAQGTEEAMEHFLRELRDTEEGGHEILRVEVKRLTLSLTLLEKRKEFAIVESGDGNGLRILPPDLPVCPSCARELYDRQNRRFGNPFISCVACGPRYTIMESMPYDRGTTSMADFDLCGACHEEYSSPGNRRHHAQTISCNDCGPYLIWQEMEHTEGEAAGGKRVETSDPGTGAWQITDQGALERAIEVLRAGGILAVKGIGGYHYVCSPFMEESVRRLRLLKGREQKPFAVMFPGLGEVKAHCRVSAEEEKLLLSQARPIVLLYAPQNTMAPAVNSGSIHCGAFLPYTPLQLMLTGECGPLIMTSANRSGQPIIREDHRMLEIRSPYLAGVLYHPRRIVRPVDDSVARIVGGELQLQRRSRGYVPYPVFMSSQEELFCEGPGQSLQGDVVSLPCVEGLKGRNPMIFAAGGDLKAAFCLCRDRAAYLSQYFGDLEETAVMDEYEREAKELGALLQISPELAVCDLHPNYYSGRYAQKLGIPVLPVQHHHAHIASVMAEHGLTGPVLGIAFDGTGYGTDAGLWGGEFLLCEGGNFIRAAHLMEIPILGGDESMKDALKTATCYLSCFGLEEYIRDDRASILQAAIKQNINCVKTTSMGRLFDAAASLLGIGQYNYYEGECAILLEREALAAIHGNIPAAELPFAFTEKNEIIEIDIKPLLRELCRLRDYMDVRSLALGFHHAVVSMMVMVSNRLRSRYRISQIAISGGVFQNAVLTEKAMTELKLQGYRVWRNIAVPPGDGGISLGQAYLGRLIHL
ncbi:hydrogenase maturation protein HypF [Anaerotaenia torta]|uniref:carbamoyltransferase HypF n=1 Tax=Anaerotaenia torta TaxID=433293 RepID=UPI003D1D2C16